MANPPRDAIREGVPMKLPWKRTDPPALQKESSELADLWWPYAAGRKLLVVEDHPPYRRYLETLLRGAGYEVISASQAEEAVQKAKDEGPDVIIMDRKLPTLRRFRALNRLVDYPDTAAIPVVMVWLRNPGNFLWRMGEKNIAYISGDPDHLLDILRRLDLAALSTQEASQGTRSGIAEQSPGIPPADNRPKRILVADDERPVVRFVEQCLRETGCEVISCFDGREVLERAKAESPDAIMLDTFMPFVHWLTVFTALKTDRATAGIPLVLLAARSPSVSHDQWVPPNSSAAAFLTKPFSPSELLTAVASALERGASGLQAPRETP
jgi:CheY-like chemotaxis protein